MPLPATPRPTLVFLHGWAAGKGIWVGLMQRLGRERRVYALDLPGHGGAPPPPDGFSPDGLADEVAADLVARDLGDCVVISHSLGTLVAVALALKCQASGVPPAATGAGRLTDPSSARHATRKPNAAVDEDAPRDAGRLVVRGLVLCNPPHPADMRRLLRPWRNDRLFRVVLGAGRRTYRALGWRAPATSPGRIAAFRRRAAAYGAVPTTVLLQTARMLERVDLMPRLAGLRVPTLVTLGRYDRLTSARGGRLIAAGIPGSHVALLPTGHEAMESHEALLADVIERWLAQHGW